MELFLWQDRFAGLVKCSAQDHFQGKYFVSIGVTFRSGPKNICNVIRTDSVASKVYLSRTYVAWWPTERRGPKLAQMYLVNYRNNVNIYEEGNHRIRFIKEDFIFMWTFASIENETSLSCSFKWNEMIGF